MHDDDLAALVNEVLATIELHVVETETRRIYCATEEDARDKVLAFALLDRLVYVTTEEVRADSVWAEEDGWIRIEERVA